MPEEDFWLVHVGEGPRVQRVADVPDLPVTTIGDFSIHHLAPELFGGYEQTDDGGHIAVPEKALFDTIYALTPRGGQIRLPELALPEEFDQRQLDAWTQRIGRPRLRTMVRRALTATLRRAAPL